MELIYKSNINVFSIEDLASIWGISDRRKLLELIKHYTRTSRLKSIKRGVYVTDKDFTELEVAQKAYTPSYISLHTALGIHGINFQRYEAVYSVSLKTKTFSILGNDYSYHAINQNIFWNPIGIDNETNYQIASVERTICDTIYLFPQTNFDNVEMVNTNKLLDISKIYNSKVLFERAKELISF